jgi:TPR repeat protein
MLPLPVSNPRTLQRIVIAAVLSFFSLTACTMDHLPRNMKIGSFDPHRKEFVCVHEADKVPPIDAIAQEWFEQGLVLSTEGLPRKDRNFKLATELWQKAVERKHWKALINLASMYANGSGYDTDSQFNPAYQVERDDEKAVLLVEQGMNWGIPAAFDLVGTLHMEGRGVNQDSSRAYAFWQLAANMGSASAMAYIGTKTQATYDNPKEGFWGNRKIALQMLECGMAQGNAAAAFEFGVTTNGDDKALDEDYGRALLALHSAVKWGHEEAAGYLGSAFRTGKPLVGNAVDRARGERYSMLGKALRLNADLRFPNLDKAIPLPPAPLPKWDGDLDTLVAAAQGVREIPKPKQTSSSYLQGHRAYLPPGTALQVPAQLSRIPVLPGYTSILADRPGSTGLARAQVGGYWQAKVLPATANESPYVSSLRKALRELPPLRFEEGERMQITMGNTNLLHEDMTHYLVEWHFVGRPAAMHESQDWLAQAGTVRAIAKATDTLCKGNQPCPQSGIWQPYFLDAEHLLSKVFSAAPLNDGWKWQAFVQEGQALPSLSAMGIEDAQVDWRLMQVTELGFVV